MTLTTEEKEDVVEALKALRKYSKNAKDEIHGWKLEWSVRKSKSATVRGDITAIDPSDGQELHSIVSLQRKLGLVEPEVVAPKPPPAAADEDDEADAPRKKKALLEAPVVIEGEGRSRRQRTVVSYAEMTASTNPRMPDLVLKALEAMGETAAASTKEEEEGGASAQPSASGDLVDIVDGVHLLSDVFEPVRPYATVQRTLGNMLKQGLLRRKLAAAPSFAHGPSSRTRASTSAATATGSGSAAAEEGTTGTSSAPAPSVKDTLSMLVLSTLQVEPEDEEVRACVGGLKAVIGLPVIGLLRLSRRARVAAHESPRMARRAWLAVAPPATCARPHCSSSCSPALLLLLLMPRVLDSRLAGGALASHRRDRGQRQEGGRGGRGGGGEGGKGGGGAGQGGQQ